MTSGFAPNDYRIKHVTDHWERRGCFELRRAVFCDEQGLFDGSDSDAIDEIAMPIAAIACIASMSERVIGTVRIHEAAPGVWYGSRLAVHADFRCIASLGKELIRHAVCTAHARGCRRFLANVQEQNVPLFRHLRWTLLKTTTVRKRPHALMQADMSFYPPRHESEIALVKAARAAA
jgi:putative N-acetyltransferase (TIGR04045 family)